MNDEIWSLGLILRSATGLSIGVFDRTCHYVAIYGALSESNAVGTRVGETNAKYGEQILEAARRAIREEKRSVLMIDYIGRRYLLHIQPTYLAPFGLVGGVIYGVDVTESLPA